MELDAWIDLFGDQLKAFYDATDKKLTFHQFCLVYYCQYFNKWACTGCEYFGRCEDDPQKPDYCPLRGQE